MSSLTPGASPVALLRWPAEAARRAELAAAGRPRLLLVDADEPPPRTWVQSEDWVRMPADPAEIEARVAGILHRNPVSAPDAMPILDGDGVLHVGSRRVPLPPIEAALASLLVQRSGSVVSREDLVAAGWPGGGSPGDLLDGRIKLLRRRLAPLGLAIHTVRGTGYLLTS